MMNNILLLRWLNDERYLVKQIAEEILTNNIVSTYRYSRSYSIANASHDPSLPLLNLTSFPRLAQPSSIFQQSDATLSHLNARSSFVSR